MHTLYTKQPRIVVADHTATGRTLLEAVLRSDAGYATISAASGAACLEIVYTEHPDLVIIDSALTGPVDALAVVAAIKADPATRRIPAVAVVSSGTSQATRERLEGAADDFLCKPFHRVELLTRVRAALRIKTLDDQLEEVDSIIVALSHAASSRRGGDFGLRTARVVRYARALGREIGLPDNELRILGQAALLRDQRNFGLADSLLARPGAWSQNERRAMTPVSMLSEVIVGSRSAGAIVDAITHLGEWFDGSGSPDSLVGDQIPLAARIIAVAQAFDAMLSHRAYRQSMTLDMATAKLTAGAGRQWDPVLVERLLAIIAKQSADFHSLK